MDFYLDSCLAQKFGITEHALEKFRARDLSKNDWKKEGRLIWIADTGLKKLREALGKPAVDCASCRQNNGSKPPATGELVELAVLRIFPNPKLIEARFIDDLNGRFPVRVACVTNVNFRAGMKIKARPPAEQSTLYRLEGRGPRFPGRW